MLSTHVAPVMVGGAWTWLLLVAAHQDAPELGGPWTHFAVLLIGSVGAWLLSRRRGDRADARADWRILIEQLQKRIQVLEVEGNRLETLAVTTAASTAAATIAAAAAAARHKDHPAEAAP